MKTELRSDLKIIIGLAAPIITENILQNLLGTTDTFFAGRLGDEAIAAISITTLIMNIVIAFFTAVAVGATAVVARYYGRGDYERVNKIIFHIIVIASALGLALGLLCFVFRSPILAFSGADATILKTAMPYYLVVVVPSLFLCLQLSLSACLRAIADTKTPMVITGGANLLNIILNAVFMALGWGVFGLGLATTLSRTLATVILYLRLRTHDKNVHPTPCPLEKKELTTILTIGIPAGLEKLIQRIGQLLYNAMIISLGTSAYVAHNIGGTIEGYSYIPAMGLGLAVANIVGTCLGENNPQRARRLTTTTYVLATALMVLIALIFYLFAPQLAALFTDTAAVQEMVVQVLRIIAFFQPFLGLVLIMTSALQGAGDTKFPMITTLIGIWGIRIGVGYTLAVVWGFGLVGVWSAYALDLVIRGLLLLFRFARGRWQTIEI